MEIFDFTCLGNALSIQPLPQISSTPLAAAFVDEPLPGSWLLDYLKPVLSCALS